MNAQDANLPMWIRTKNGVAFSDVPERPGGRVPDFCIIGAAKCATTTINALLEMHPGVFMNPLKEPHFFSTEVQYARGMGWYKGLHADALDQQVVGEASTSYARYPFTSNVPERIAAANPQMKILYIVREPVERLESACLQTLKYVRYVLEEDVQFRDLDDLLDQLSDPASDMYQGATAASEYATQIEQYEAHFPEAQIKVLFYDDFRRDRDAFLKRICRFIGVDDGFVFPAAILENQTKPFLDGLERERAAGKLKQVPGAQMIKRLMPRKLRNLAVDLVRGGTKPQVMQFSMQRRRKLAEHFQPHNRKLLKWVEGGPIPWVDG
ncbi:MAG: sulfotransferase [Pseudomonadota bacterium]